MPRSHGKSGHGSCSYCGRVHRRGKKRNDSCRGHAVRKSGSSGPAVTEESGTKKKRTGEPNKGIAREHKRRKREAAIERVALWQALTPQKQLTELEGRRGKAARQVRRLYESIRQTKDQATG